MVLRELELLKFKAFSGSGKIPIRPITLIYGPNSSGKSSIIQSILLLKQTLSEAEDPNILLQPKGKLVDLGGVREFVHRHDTKETFGFRLVLESEEWHARGPFLYERSPHVKPRLDKNIGMNVTFTFDESLEKAVLSSLDLIVGLDQPPALTFKPDTKKDRKLMHGFAFGWGPTVRAGQTLLRVEKANYDHPFWQEVWAARNAALKEEASEIARKLNAHRRRLERLQEGEQLDSLAGAGELRERKEKLDQRMKQLEAQLQKLRDYSYATTVKDFETAHRNCFLTCRNFLPVDVRFTRGEQQEEDIYPSVAGYLAGPAATMTVAAEIRRFLDSITYLGPLRENPDRQNIFSGSVADDVGKTGKLVPDILFKDAKVLQKVNEHFETFNFGYRLEVASARDRRPELTDVFALRLVDRFTGVNVSIVDVGFGISQVLPIIVQSMLSSNKTLLIEQPEIHLHPRLQSEIANLFCEAIGEPYQNNFIIETHSEHLILRLQRLIRSGSLKPENLSIVYVDRTEDGSRCIPLRLDSKGEFIDRWPGGFFEESYYEIFS